MVTTARLDNLPLAANARLCQGSHHYGRLFPLLDGGQWWYEDKAEPGYRNRGMRLCHGCLAQLLDAEIPGAHFFLLEPPQWAAA